MRRLQGVAAYLLPIDGLPTKSDYPLATLHIEYSVGHVRRKRKALHLTPELEPPQEYIFFENGGSNSGEKQHFFAESKPKHGTNRGSNGAREHGVVSLIIRDRRSCGIIQLLIRGHRQT